jgi:hypothetical protein
MTSFPESGTVAVVASDEERSISPTGPGSHLYWILLWAMVACGNGEGKRVLMDRIEEAGLCDCVTMKVDVSINEQGQAGKGRY